MRRALNAMKRRPEIKARFSGKKVRIWSAQWQQWWRRSPDGSASGYTTAIRDAGIYDFEDAWARSSHCGPEKKIVYEIVPEARRATMSGTTDGLKSRLERMMVLARRLEDIGTGGIIYLGTLKDIEANATELRVIVADALAILGSVRPAKPDEDDVWVPDDPESPGVDIVNDDESL